MDTLIAYAIYGLVFVAAFHFVYEAIILPSARLKHRFRLFALRDRLRTLKAENPRIDDEAFHALDDAISWQMDHLHRLTISFMRKVGRLYESNPAFRDHVAERLAILDRCQLTEFKDIRKDLGDYFTQALTINAGAWFVYLVPIALCVVCLDKIKEKVRKTTALTNEELDNVDDLSMA